MQQQQQKNIMNCTDLVSFIASMAGLSYFPFPCEDKMVICKPKRTMDYEIILTVHLYGEDFVQTRKHLHSLLTQGLFCKGLNLVLLNKIHP